MVESSKSALITDTPEFKEAVAKAVADAAPGIVAATVAELSKTSASPLALGAADEATREFFSRMALSIAEISDQGTNRKRVAPEILAKRAQATERLERLLHEVYNHVKRARQAEDREQEDAWSPQYRLVAKVYLGERLIEPYRRLPDRTVVQQEIVWMGVPNEAMRPVNSVAEDIFNAYRDSVGSSERLKSIKGAHGGIVAQDTRPVWMTPGGLVVKGDAPPKAFVAASIEDDQLRFKDNNDPNATEVRVLGTIHPAAKRNAADQMALQGAHGR